MRVEKVDDLPVHLRKQAAARMREWTQLPLAVSPTETVPTEHEEQAALFAWADAHPVAKLMYANVNGQYRQGQRPEPGLKAGVPDVFLPVPRGGQHGLYIEVKRRRGGRVSEAQQRWIDALIVEGYAVGLSYGADEAIELIEEYLGGGGC